MAARRNNTSPQQATKTDENISHRTKKAAANGPAEAATLADAQLPPLSLVRAVLLCSGFLTLLALRDLMTTGRNLLGDIDEAYLVSPL